MNEKTAEGPAVAASVPAAGAVTRLRGLRLGRGLTLEDVAEAVGSSDSRISALELGRKPPSVTLAQKLAAFYNVDVGTLGFGEPHACRYSPDCAAMTFGEICQRHALGVTAAAARSRENDELHAYKRRYRMVGVPELAELLDVCEATITSWVRDDLLPARRYPGRWSSEERRPLVFGKRQVAIATTLAASGNERRAAGVSDSYRGRPFKPRKLIRRPCARPDCKNERTGRPKEATFYSRWDLAWRRGYCSRRCAAIDLRRYGWGLSREAARLWRLHRGRVLGRSKKGEAKALETGRRAQALLSGRPVPGPERDRLIIERLMYEFVDPRVVPAVRRGEINRRDNGYRAARTQIVRRLRRAALLLDDPQLRELASS